MHEGVTEDFLLGRKLRLRQPERGFRANVDSVLLAAAIESAPGMRLMEAGCGAGAALLCAAFLSRETHFIGVERESALVELARQNAKLNGLEARISIEQGDVLAGDGRRFDGVFVNPPFDDAVRSQKPAAARAHAYLTEAPIDVWIRRLADRLNGGAALTLIHRAHRLGDILASLAGRLGDVRVLPIRPLAGAPAKRILVRARKGSRAPLILLDGLDLQETPNGGYTKAADAILCGETQIDWD
jgi:tRNA1(Val) A37 N6-methylase TrmN6